MSMSTDLSVTKESMESQDKMRSSMSCIGLFESQSAQEDD